VSARCNSSWTSRDLLDRLRQLLHALRHRCLIPRDFLGALGGLE